MQTIIVRLLFTSIFLAHAVNCIAQNTTDKVEKEHLELEIYRLRVPELMAQIKDLQSDRVGACAAGTANSPIVDKAYDRYASTYFDQETHLRETRIKVFEWQIFAANWVLGLVALLSISGVTFAGFQLWTATKLAKSEATSVDLELSKEKVRLQTSVVGIVILVISGGFLILFLHDVYKVDVVGTAGQTVLQNAKSAEK